MTEIRKGAIFVIEEKKQMYFADYRKSEPYMRYSFAEAVSSSRDGIVKKFRTRPNYPAYDFSFRHGSVRALSLPDNLQAKARALWEGSDTDYDSGEAIKAVLLK